MTKKGHSFKKKTLTRWTLSYLFATLIPLLLVLIASLIMLFVNSSALTYSNQITAQYVQRSFSDVLERMNQIKAEIIVDSDFMEIRTVQDLNTIPSLSLFYHASDVRRLAQTSSNISELFLFSPTNDWYINESTWGKISEMADKSNSPMAQEEIDRMLTKEIWDVYMYDISPDSVLVVSPLTFIKSTNPNNLVVGVIVSKEELFSSVIDNYHDVVIYNEKTNSIQYNLSGKYPVGKAESFSEISGVETTKKIGNSIISVGDKTILNLRCIVIIDKSIYFHEYYLFLRIIAFIILFAATFGGILIVGNVRKDWLLYSEAMEVSGLDVNKIPQNATTYMPFVSSVSDLKEQKKYLNEVIIKQNTSLVESAIKKLINGDNTVTKDVLSSLGLELVSLCFCVVILKAQKGKNAQDCLKEVIASSLVIPFQSEYGESFILNTKFSDESSYNDMIDHIYEKGKAGDFESVSISSLHNGLDSIKDCYIEAISVHEYQENHKIAFFSYEELSNRTRQNAYQYTLEENMLLQKALKEGDAEKAKSIVNSVIDRNKMNGASPKTLRFLLFSISGTIIRTINSFDERYAEVIPGINFPPIMQSQNFQKSLVGVEEIIDSTCYSVKAIQDSLAESSSETYQVYKNVIEYIHANYMNAMINVSSIADHFDISIAYLSRIFKKYHGINISEYITLYRLDRAKELLNEKKMVGEVVDKCGFGSLRTFLRVFKSVEGITPGQYKHSVVKED